MDTACAHEYPHVAAHVTRMVASAYPHGCACACRLEFLSPWVELHRAQVIQGFCACEHPQRPWEKQLLSSKSNLLTISAFLSFPFVHGWFSLLLLHLIAPYFHKRIFRSRVLYIHYYV